MYKYYPESPSIDNSSDRINTQQHTNLPLLHTQPDHQMDLQGICTISQGDLYLTEFNGHAVTTIAGGEDITWSLTHHPDAPGSRELIIMLTSGPRGGETTRLRNVLTLGKKTEEEGIQVFLEPLHSPPSKSQLWTLENVLATKRFPPLAHSEIRSVEYLDLSLGTGVLHIPLPKIFANVAAAPKGEGNQMWKLDFKLPLDD